MSSMLQHTPWRVLVLLVRNPDDAAVTQLAGNLRLRTNTEVTYVITDNVEVGGNLDSAGLFIDDVLESSDNYDILYIPHSTSQTSSDAVQGTKKLVNKANDIFASGNGRKILITTGLMEGRIASNDSLSDDIQVDYPGVIWTQAPIVREFCYWTFDSSSESLHDIALLYSSYKHGALARRFPLISSSNTVSEDDSPQDSGATDDLGQKLAQQISTSPASEEFQLILEISHFALSLGVEGFMSECNEVLVSLLRVFPNAQSLLLGEVNVQKHFEFLWANANLRPAVAWEAPTARQLDNWDTELKDTYKFPPVEERNAEIDMLAARIRHGDSWLEPYRLSGAVVMAVEQGRDAEAEKWMHQLLRECGAGGYLSWTYDLAKWRAMGKFFTSGFVARSVGRTAETAYRDAETVKAALERFQDTSSALAEGRRAARERISRTSWKELVHVLENLRWEEHETLLKPPASGTAVSEAEAHLGIELPADYKQFLAVSNGIEFMPSVNAPGFKPVGDLRWQDAETLGLGEWRVDLGCATDPPEYDSLPKMGRVLVVSDEASEEMVWYVHPETVADSRKVLESLGRSGETLGEPGWRAVFWVNWMTELRWLRSFRDYMETLAVEGEKRGDTMQTG